MSKAVFPGLHVEWTVEDWKDFWLTLKDFEARVRDRHQKGTTMAVPASFAESNTVLGKPDSMSHEECEALSVYRGDNADGAPVVVSCWKLTCDELSEILRTGRVWLVTHGYTMPPAHVTGNTPFQPEPSRVPAGGESQNHNPGE